MSADLDLHALYEQEVDTVHAYLVRFGLRGAEAEDAVHDTFVTALRRKHTYDPGRPPRPWLLGIAFRVAVARARSSRPREGPERLDEQHDPAQNPERGLEARDAKALVDRALQRLGEDQRTVFVMYDLQGVPMAQIAEAMGTPVATAYSRLRLGRQAFTEAVHALQGSRGAA